MNTFTLYQNTQNNASFITLVNVMQSKQFKKIMLALFLLIISYMFISYAYATTGAGLTAGSTTTYTAMTTSFDSMYEVVIGFANSKLILILSIIAFLLGMVVGVVKQDLMVAGLAIGVAAIGLFLPKVLVAMVGAGI